MQVTSNFKNIICAVLMNFQGKRLERLITSKIFLATVKQVKKYFIENITENEKISSVYVGASITPSNDQCAISGTLQVYRSYCCMGSMFAAPSISPDLERFNESDSQLQSKKF